MIASAGLALLAAIGLGTLYVVLSSRLPEVESLREVLNFAFDHCGFHRLQANVLEGNDGSRRVLEKCGFQMEGRLRDSYRIGDEWKNDWLLGLLATDPRP